MASRGAGVWAADLAVEDRRGVSEDPRDRPDSAGVVEPGAGGGLGWLVRAEECGQNHPEDYPEYLKGCDIASFDIYPASHDREEIAGKLWYVPLGVDRLRTWTEDRKPVWACIETTRISNRADRADAGAGEVGGLDGADPRGEGDHLLLP